ncbi:MAG: hypothetical protein HYV03_05710, partial [Deltaproteobacteria bacterium]|nr:hypothetical protein [Deltaproteobacteria bacterium]
MTVRPFRFALKQVTADEIRLLKTLHQFLPLQCTRSRLTEAVADVLAKHLGGPARVTLERARTLPFDEWAGTLERLCTVAVIDLPPHTGRIFCRIDASLAAVAVERLLGGEPELPVGTHPLTETEQGVLQYLLMAVLAAAHSSCGGAPRLHFRFERLLVRPDEVAAIGGSELCGLCDYRVQAGEVSGIVQLAIPGPFAEAALAEPLRLPHDLNSAEAAYLARRLGAFSWVRSTLWVEGGGCELTADELAGLEPGDVVLFDHSGLRLGDGAVNGEVTLRVGPGRTGGLRGRIVPGERFGVKLVGIE